MSTQSTPEGERLGEVEGTSRDSVLMSALAPLQYPVGDGVETAVEFAIDPAKFHDAFAADLPAGQTAVMAATQRPVAEAAFSEPSGPPRGSRCIPGRSSQRATGRPARMSSGRWPSGPERRSPRRRAHT
jgi:hypothetical protein